MFLAVVREGMAKSIATMLNWAKLSPLLEPDSFDFRCVSVSHSSVVEGKAPFDE